MAGVTKVVVGAIAGGAAGGALFFLASQLAGPVVVWLPVHEPGTLGKRDALDVSDVLARVAAVVGAGAVCGAVAGANGGDRPRGPSLPAEA